MSWLLCFDFEDRYALRLFVELLVCRHQTYHWDRARFQLPLLGKAFSKDLPSPSPPSFSHPRLPLEWHGAQVRWAPTPSSHRGP
jgi:hypothetical protein